MKIDGTELNLPLPDDWTYDLVGSKLSVFGTQPDSDSYRDRHISVEFTLDDNRCLGAWHSRAQIFETRLRQKRQWVSKGTNKWNNYVFTGKWTRSFAARKMNHATVLLYLANGWTL
jgi:hypothetical protein